MENSWGKITSFFLAPDMREPDVYPHILALDAIKNMCHLSKKVKEFCRRTYFAKYLKMENSWEPTTSYFETLI